MMVSRASPVPAEPKMKVESRALMVAPCGGYTTRSSSFPVARGTGGNDAGAASVSLALRGALEGPGVGTVAQPATIERATHETGANRRGARCMKANLIGPVAAGESACAVAS